MTYSQSRKMVMMKLWDKWNRRHTSEWQDKRSTLRTHVGSDKGSKNPKENERQHRYGVGLCKTWVLQSLPQGALRCKLICSINTSKSEKFLEVGLQMFTCSLSHHHPPSALLQTPIHSPVPGRWPSKSSLKSRWSWNYGNYARITGLNNADGREGRHS